MDIMKMRAYIENSLKLVAPEMTEIKRTPGGMTNDSYFVTVNGEQYVVRIPGKGTEVLIDREAEKNNLLYGTALGINPELVYFDSDSGVKITRKIAYSKTLTLELFRDKQIMNIIITVFQSLHRAKAVMKNRFELFSVMHLYEELVSEVNPFMLEKVVSVKDKILQLQKVYESLNVEESPCHIDTVPENILLNIAHNRVYLIDWEYSGMFDPLWDVATLFQSFDLTEEAELFFLKKYLEREPVQEDLQRILLHKIFQDYLWSLWTIYKETKGDDFGTRVVMRIERAMKHIAQYDAKYNYDNVV